MVVITLYNFRVRSLKIECRAIIFQNTVLYVFVSMYVLSLLVTLHYWSSITLHTLFFKTPLVRDHLYITLSLLVSCPPPSPPIHQSAMLCFIRLWWGWFLIDIHNSPNKMLIPSSGMFMMILYKPITYPSIHIKMIKC